MGCSFDKHVTFIVYKDRIEVRRCCLDAGGKNIIDDVAYLDDGISMVNILSNVDMLDSVCNGCRVCPDVSFETIEEATVCIQWGCNIDCYMCQTKVPNINNKSIDLYFSVIDALKDRPLHRLQLTTTGEPFLNKEKTFKAIESIIEANKIGAIRITTNGTLLTEEDITKLADLNKYGNIEIIVSCSATNKKTYNKIHCGGNFDTVWKNILLLKDKGLLLNVAYVVNPFNIKQAKKDVKKFNNNGISVGLLEVRHVDKKVTEGFNKLVKYFNGSFVTS